MEKHEQSGARAGSPAPQPESVHVVDVAFGVLAQVVATVGVVRRPLRRVLEPAAHLMLRPPVLPVLLQPATVLSRVSRRGASFRRKTIQELVDLLDAVVAVTASDLQGHLDLTELVREHVDVDRLLLTVDLVGVAEDVIAGIDLPAIIRDSTSAVASDTLLGVRMQSISGDDALGRAVDRLRLRLARRTPPPEAPEGVADAETIIVDGASPSGAKSGTPR